MKVGRSCRYFKSFVTFVCFLLVQSIVLIIAMIGCTVATGPLKSSLFSDLSRKSLHVQGGPLGGSISADLPSLRSLAPILSQLAPLALSLGNIGSISERSASPLISKLLPLASSLGDAGSIAERSVAPLLSQLVPLALSLGNPGNLGDLTSISELASLGARLLPPIPVPQIRTVPISLPIPIPSFAPVSYSTQSLIPYPYGLYAGARLF